jgi:hypothetical protein
MPKKVADPHPNHVCTWVWDGIAWQGSRSGCSIEESCAPPPQNGFFIGQTAETDCGVDDG